MKRPAHIWLAFSVCTAAGLLAMVGLSAAALRAERAERRAQRQARIEENVRLALWRMDSAIAPLIAEESARPYFTYHALYPVNRPYERMYREDGLDEPHAPSPLLTNDSPHIVLHFQIDPRGHLTSPQVPEAPLGKAAAFIRPERLARAREHLQALRPSLSSNVSLITGQCAVATIVDDSQTPGNFMDVVVARNPDLNLKDLQQGKARGDLEWQARQYYSLRNAVEQADLGAMWNDTIFQDSPRVRSGIVMPLWVDSRLILVRQVDIDGQVYIQGAWLNWEVLRKELLADIADLLPTAQLFPAEFSDGSDPARMQATLPVRLEPGEVPMQSSSSISPLQLALVLSWACMLLAAAAVARLLMAIISLSERRAAFVGAVTHELRTPLTTLRMYSQMLADGMITAEPKRSAYLDRIRTEADRLGQLVDNVLAYARLEGRRSGSPREQFTVHELLQRLVGRLQERARDAGMELLVDQGRSAESATVQVDEAAVEQILFNLVDNACKYAVSGVPRHIHLDVRDDGPQVELRLCDNGPGIQDAEAQQLFRPFCKPDRGRDRAATGVGLGLALSRNLAREMGGDLKLDRRAQRGACFVLSLPRGI